MQSRNIYIRHEKLSNVIGRIEYTNALKDEKKRTEQLKAVYDTSFALVDTNSSESSFWKELASFNQSKFKSKEPDAKCIEARELVIEVPNEFIDYDPHHLAKTVAEWFKKNYEVECNAALHMNDTRTNYHMHLIFSERKLDQENMKIAQRNLFINEHGKRVYKKSEILNEDGSIREGCRIIKKGTAEKLEFTSKISYFKSQKFTHDIKENFAALWTDTLKNIDIQKEYQVFNHDDVYLPQVKIKKGTPDELKEQLEEFNANVREYNEYVEAILDLDENRRGELKDIKDYIYENSKDQFDWIYIFNSFVKLMIDELKDMYDRLKATVKDIFKNEDSLALADRIKKWNQIRDEQEYDRDDDYELEM